MLLHHLPISLLQIVLYELEHYQQYISIGEVGAGLGSTTADFFGRRIIANSTFDHSARITWKKGRDPEWESC